MQRLCFPIGLQRNAGNALKIKKSRNWLPFPVVPHTRHAIPHTHTLYFGGLSICVHWPLWLRFDFCRHEKQRKVCETFSRLPNCWAKFFGFSFALSALPPALALALAVARPVLERENYFIYMHYWKLPQQPFTGSANTHSTSMWHEVYGKNEYIPISIWVIYGLAMLRT